VSAAAVAAAAAAIRARIGSLQPEVAITLGSGLGQLAAKVRDAVRIPYDEIPGFHAPTVPGHKGELVIGTLGSRVVVAQSGRFHMYEGYGADVSALPVRIFADLGVSTFVVTNAAGGIRPGFVPGTIMLISDHLNLTGRTPLLGPALPGEERFPDMSAAYDPDLRARARRVAATLGIAVEEGVYAGLVGPSYETPAEIRMLATMGADAVGMSTVMEVVAARARGLRCLGISNITNAAAGLGDTKLSHAEVMEAAAKTGEAVAVLIEGVVGNRE
jgi:purine-nucleoside phosphorylase